MRKERIFFLTYAWLIAIVFIIILFLSTSNTLRPRSICQIDEGFSCRNVVLTQQGISFELYNELNQQAAFSSIKVTGDYIDCTPKSLTIPANSMQILQLECTRQQNIGYDAAISATYSKTITGKLFVK